MVDLMLAGKITDLEQLRFPLLASPKLDGIRATVLNEDVISRNNKLIRNRFVQQTFGLNIFDGLDGELIVGNPTSPSCFRDTSSGVMSEDGQPDVTLYLFDRWGDSRDAQSFKKRLNDVKSLITDCKHPRVKVVPHVTIKTLDELLRYEEVCLTKGYEGVMLRDPNGPYKHGRSTEKEGWLLKLKRFEDSEAIILDSIELRHNLNEKGADGKRTTHAAGKVAGGVLGAWLVRDLKTKAEFEVGTGFTREQRVEFWQLRNCLKGRMITYRFFPTGSKDKPRFPVFKGFREDL